jgi:hypothetical protein
VNRLGRRSARNEAASRPRRTSHVSPYVVRPRWRRWGQQLGEHVGRPARPSRPATRRSLRGPTEHQRTLPSMASPGGPGWRRGRRRIPGRARSGGSHPRRVPRRRSTPPAPERSTVQQQRPIPVQRGSGRPHHGGDQGDATPTHESVINEPAGLPGHGRPGISLAPGNPQHRLQQPGEPIFTDQEKATVCTQESRPPVAEMLCRTPDNPSAGECSAEYCALCCWQSPLGSRPRYRADTPDRRRRGSGSRRRGFDARRCPADRRGEPVRGGQLRCIRRDASRSTSPDRLSGVHSGGDRSPQMCSVADQRGDRLVPASPAPQPGQPHPQRWRACTPSPRTAAAPMNTEPQVHRRGRRPANSTT